MNWLRTNYDRAASLGAALFLLLCAFFVFLNSSSFGSRFSALQNMSKPNRNIPAGRASEIAEAMARLQSPSQWSATGRTGLFVPEKHFIDANGEPATLQNTVLHPPVPNDWLEEFSLPITESDVLTQDPDNDGFTNLDEWQGHSVPVDKDSHPPYSFKLKLRSYAEEAFPLIFASSMADTFAINNVDPSKPTQFLKLGETVKGTKYKLKEYAEKFAADKYGTRMDVSELTLEQVDTHDVVKLVKEMRATSPESVANFLYSWGGREQTFAVKKDQEFSLKPQEEIKYKLEAVQPDNATIIQIQKPNEKIQIVPAKP